MGRVDPEKRRKEEGPSIGYNECKSLVDGIWLGNQRLLVSEVGWDLSEWCLGDGWGGALGPRGLWLSQVSQTRGASSLGGHFGQAKTGPWTCLFITASEVYGLPSLRMKPGGAEYPWVQVTHPPYALQFEVCLMPPKNKDTWILSGIGRGKFLITHLKLGKNSNGLPWKQYIQYLKTVFQEVTKQLSYILGGGVRVI